MNPRERFLAAISREQPDRVPKSADFTPRALQTFKEQTGCDSPAEHFAYEMREVGFHPTRQQVDFSFYLGELPEGSIVSEWGVGEIPAHLYHLTQMVHPMRELTSVGQIKRYPFPDYQAAYRHADLGERIAAVHRRGLATVSDRYLSFWGSIGVQSTLPFGTPEQVRHQVRQRMETIGKGGGLVIAPSHVIPPETPWGNISAFFEAVGEFGQYRA